MSNSHNRRRNDAFLSDRYVCLSAFYIIFVGFFFFITEGRIKKKVAELLYLPQQHSKLSYRTDRRQKGEVWRKTFDKAASLSPVSIVSACCRKHLNGLLITTTSLLIFIFTAGFPNHKMKEYHTASWPACIGFLHAQDLYRFKPHSL